jgi:uncharacterized protein (TIGR02996 family)
MRAGRLDVVTRYEEPVDDRAALFSNVLEQPADDAARLVLADRLEENSEADFGRFVRAGVVAARYSSEEFIDDPDYYSALAAIAVAKSGEPARWVAALGLGPVHLTDRDWSWDSAGDRVTVLNGAESLKCRPPVTNTRNALVQVCAPTSWGAGL